MLNEFIEYKEYTDIAAQQKISINKPKRMARLKKKKIVMNNQDGIKRPLRIISRHFINKTNNKEVAINAMKAWLGLEYNPSLDAELKKIERMFYKSINDDSNDSKETYKLPGHCINTLNIKSTNLKSQKDEDEVNTENMITFENIFYTEIKNKMKNRVLVCDYNFFDNNQLYFKKLQVSNLELIKKDKQDYILKIIAAYLMNKIFPNQETIRIVLTDVGNWGLIHTDAWGIGKYYWKDGANFCESFENGRSTTIKIHKNVISHFRLVDITNKKNNELENQFNVGETVYIDQGKNFLKTFDIVDKNAKMRLLQELISETGQ